MKEMIVFKEGDQEKTGCWYVMAFLCKNLMVHLGDEMIVFKGRVEGEVNSGKFRGNNN